jgi:chromate reductase
MLEWRDVPPFDADMLAQGRAGPVARLHRAIADADGMVIATPEYNFSLPGMLKNVIDWLSRGEDQALFAKPVAILSATTGPLGGARVQYALRQALLCLDASVLTKPEVFIGQAQTKFDADGQCTDNATRAVVRAQMRSFADWITAGRRPRT